MNIRLTCASEGFYLLRIEDVKVRIIILFLPQVKLKPSVPLAHAYVVDMTRKAHCPVTILTADAGPNKSLNHNAFVGPNPRSFVIVVVKNTAFVGFTVQTPSVSLITIC